MIPLRLRLSGFLSYRDPVELDFTRFDLACISGANGAGKSSLLDAMVWALFGQARKRDETLIHTHPENKAAEVIFVFAYEGNLFRVQRSLARGKSTLLEFQLYQGEAGAVPDDLDAVLLERGAWKPLTGSTLRETQSLIQNTLRMDYETFTNASFFLQGKADQFTQQRPADRKRILGSILGLEIWEVYKERAAERRKSLESQIAALQGSLQEINLELAEEASRTTRLSQLRTELERLAQVRQVQTSALENIRRAAATLNEQRRLVDALTRQVDATSRRRNELQTRSQSRQAELNTCQELLGRTAAIQAAYAVWQQTLQELQRWDETAARFHDQEPRRQGPLKIIAIEEGRLRAEKQALAAQQTGLRDEQNTLAASAAQRQTSQQKLDEINAQLQTRAEVENDLRQARQRLADARAENPRLKAEMDDLKARINRLQTMEGSICPFCGQPLEPEQRELLVTDLFSQGVERGDRWRANRILLDQADQVVNGLEARLAGFARLEAEAQMHQRTLDQAAIRLQQFAERQAAWEQTGAPRLAEIDRLLAEQSFAQAARQELAVLDAELKAIGYDAAEHDAVRRREIGGRSAEAELRELEKARATQAALEREIALVQTQQAEVEIELAQQRQELAAASALMAQAQAQSPDLAAAERQLFAMQEQENRLRLEVGAAQQKVEVLEDLKLRKKELESAQEEIARQVARLRQLERAFGKDGVPALLIEQALPQIEEKANELLDRLSGGSMSVRFVTQADYKDKKREDKKETLEIQISDGSGTRDYELYSGGEAFRVNFAIRLALSEVLAQRAGARLQMLVVDEGFGSQDAQGRQRLIEAINLVRPDFAKILVITHIDELKDAFPTRIEVEKTARGSALRIA